MAEYPIGHISWPEPKFRIGDKVQHSTISFGSTMVIAVALTDGLSWSYYCTWVGNNQGHQMQFPEHSLRLYGDTALENDHG